MSALRIEPEVEFGFMKSYKSLTGTARGGLAVLPTLEERVDSDRESESSSNSSLSLDDHLDSSNNYHYPTDPLGVSWGSYLFSVPPTRDPSGGPSTPSAQAQERSLFGGNSAPEAKNSMTAGVPSSATPPRQLDKTLTLSNKAGEKERSRAADHKSNEPHPLLQHLEGLMIALVRSKQELTKCGLDVTPLTPLCDATLASHNDLKKLVKMLSMKNTGSESVISSDLIHNLVEYFREVLHGLIEQGRKVNVQAAFLQHTAKKLNRDHQRSLKEQSNAREAIDSTKSQMELEKKSLERERSSIYEAKLELKRMLQEAEESLNHTCGMKKKGRMGSPHSVAQGRSQLAALIKTQKQQFRLEKALTQQQRDIRYLQQAHDLTKSELLAVQDHATKLQRKLVKKIAEVKNSESALTSQLQVTQESLAHPSIALDKEKRKSYHNTSKSQIKATLKGIAASQKTLSTEIERMQRQFSEQHTTEQRISRQLEESSQRLVETDSRLKHHTASIKRGRGHHRTTPQHHDSEERLTLPEITRASTKPLSKTQRSENVKLPRLLQQSSNEMTAAVKSSRLQHLPSYQFSKTELFTLAKFDDRETAEQVSKWLQSQGKLLR